MLLVLALAAAAAPALQAKPLTLTLGAAAPAETPRSRYRLDRQVDDGPDMKRTALATDGSACSVVGAKLCTRKPRTVLSAELTN